MEILVNTKYTVGDKILFIKGGYRSENTLVKGSVVAIRIGGDGVVMGYNVNIQNYGLCYVEIENIINTFEDIDRLMEKS